MSDTEESGDDDTNPTNDEDVLEQARKRFNADVEGWSEVRDAALDDMRFSLLSEQWPADVAAVRARESRPCLVINKTKAFIRQVVNDARQNKPAIRVRPVDSAADIRTAEVINGIFRNIEHISHADVAYDTAVEQATSGAFGFIRIDVDYACDDTADLDILIRRVPNQFAVHFPYDTEAEDSSDWDHCFIEQMMDRKVFEKKWPGAQSGEFDGDDKINPWFTDSQVRVAEYFDRVESMRDVLFLSDGRIIDKDAIQNLAQALQAGVLTVKGERKVKSYKVIHRLITAADVLETTPWLGTKIPVAPVYGEEFNIEGKRYFRALIHDAKDPQRMINYWRTTATELVALAPKAPWIGPVKAFITDKDKWATANTDTHAYLRYDGDVPPQRTAFAGVPAGALQEALNASDDMKAVIGTYDAGLGARSNETSGIAIDKRKTESDVNTFHFIDNLTRGIRCVGEIVLDLIPKVYSQSRIIRILGEDGKTQNVTIGPKPPMPPGMPPQSGAPAAPQLPGAPPMLPSQASQPVPDDIYDLTVGKYDLIVEAGPGYTTKRQEAADQMMQLVTAFPAAAPVIGDLVAKNLDWPGADKIAERLHSMLPPQILAAESGQPMPPPPPPPEVAAAQAKAQASMAIEQQKAQHDFQLAQQNQQHKIELEKVQAQADIAVMQQKAQAEIVISRERAQVEAELKRQEAQLQAELQMQRSAAPSLSGIA